MIDIHVDRGTVTRGQYGTITVVRDATIEDGVVFDNLIVHGTVRCMTCAGGRVSMDSGTLECRGDMVVDRINGHGRLSVSGSVRCGTLDLTGRLVTHGGITARHTLWIRGLVDSGGDIVGQDVMIDGTARSSAGMSASRTVLIRPLEGLTLNRHAKTYLDRSRVSAIHGQSVSLRATTCHQISGHEVSIERGCVVHTVRFTSRLVQDPTSSILFVDGNRRNIQRRTA